MDECMRCDYNHDPSPEMFSKESDYPKRFTDTICHQHTFTDHLADIECHYNELVTVLAKTAVCNVAVSYPEGKTFPKQTALPKSIFMLPDYHMRLKETGCLSVFRQYSVGQIHEAIATGNLMKPDYKLAPMNASIQFFKASIPLNHHPTLTPRPKRLYQAPFSSRYTYTYSISRSAFDEIQSEILPNFFSWMDNEAITRPIDQGLCGSCWAVSSTTCLSDVFVASKNVPNPHLSWNYILSCMPQDQCKGGNPFEAIHTMVLHGARTQECIDGLSTSSAENPCKCVGPSPTYFPTDTKVLCIPPNLKNVSEAEASVLQSYLNQLYGSTTSMDLSSVSSESIQRLICHHIYHYGPVVTGFHVYKNFLLGDFRTTNDVYIETETYQGTPGINYDQPYDNWVGSHAVVIVGWGSTVIQSVTVPYWIVRNSWGETWGPHKGIFRMPMYGTTPYRNRISQFEYPSIVTTDVGYGVTGGVLLFKAGDILSPSIEAILPENRITTLPVVHPSPIRMTYLYSVLFGSLLWITVPSMRILVTILLLVFYLVKW
jgi:C1A family cysteine protease